MSADKEGRIRESKGGRLRTRATEWSTTSVMRTFRQHSAWWVDLAGSASSICLVGSTHPEVVRRLCRTGPEYFCQLSRSGRRLHYAVGKSPRQRFCSDYFKALHNFVVSEHEGRFVTTKSMNPGGTAQGRNAEGEAGGLKRHLPATGSVSPYIWLTDPIAGKRVSLGLQAKRVTPVEPFAVQTATANAASPCTRCRTRTDPCHRSLADWCQSGWSS